MKKLLKSKNVIFGKLNITFYYVSVHLNKLNIIVKTMLIIMQVAIGKKNVEFSDLKIISPGK